MQSKNASSAENQQERQFLIGWIVGFVDGEGCFSISVIKNLTTVSGTQIFPEFVVTQGEKSLKSLEILRDYFDCGHIYVNRRNDNHRENLYRYCVRSQKDLRERVIPFFTENPLVTSKGKDFTIFKHVLGKMRNNEHLSVDGYKSILDEISMMNRKKKRD